jgi:hypothetical protein
VELQFLYVEAHNIFLTWISFQQFIHISDTNFPPSFSPPLICLVKVHITQIVHYCQCSYSTPKTPQFFKMVSTSAQLIFSKHSF